MLCRKRSLLRPPSSRCSAASVLLQALCHKRLAALQVVATDGDEEVVSLLDANIQRNLEGKGNLEGEGAGSVRAVRLRWGEHATEEELRASIGLDGAPDVLLATGCVYGSNSGIWNALAASMAALAGPHTLVLMAHGSGAAPGVHQLRGPFYEAAAELGFTVSRVPQHTLHPEHQQGCQLHCLTHKGAGEALQPIAQPKTTTQTKPQTKTARSKKRQREEVKLACQAA